MDDNRYRDLPSVDRLLAHPLLSRDEAVGSELRATVAREAIAAARQRIAAGEDAPSLDHLAASAAEALAQLFRAGPRRVINATGVVVQTNLGRAPLSDAALAAAAEASRDYSDLEFDLTAGARGSRDSHLESLLCRLTGAEAAVVVNNNAAALFLALSGLAGGREVIVSRGHAVEIGGGFRIPDVLRQSGAELVEVGTTNRTYVSDYEAAITERTAALLRVHSSNFRIIGFTHEASIGELADLARRHRVLLLDDLGSGCVIDTAQFGLAPEPLVQESVSSGASLTFFSGDKLLGGPQAGIVVGRRESIAVLRRHPLARALRPDKTTIAALAATLVHYLRGEALTHIPVWRMIATPAEALRERALGLARLIGEGAATQPSLSMIGGGSLPGESLPTTVVALTARGDDVSSADELAARLRAADPPVVGRIERDAVLLDPRTIPPEDDAVVARAVCRAFGRAG